MTALAADRDTGSKDAGGLLAIAVEESTTIYAGGGVMVNAAGYAIPAADTASCIPMGVATTQADNSSGDDGDINVKVWTRGKFVFAHAAATQANVGDSVYWTDDQTVEDSGATNDVPAGKITAIISATEVEVDITSAMSGGTLV